MVNLINALLKRKDLVYVVDGTVVVIEYNESDEYKSYLDKVRKARAVIIMDLSNKPLRDV